MFRYKFWDDRIKPKLFPVAGDNPSIPVSSENVERPIGYLPFRGEGEGLDASDPRAYPADRIQSLRNLLEENLALGARSNRLNEWYIGTYKLDEAPGWIAGLNMTRKPTEASPAAGNETRGIYFEAGSFGAPRGSFPQENAFEQAFDPFVPNRIRCVKRTGNFDASKRFFIKISERPPTAGRAEINHEFSIGTIMLFDEWDELDLPGSCRVESIVPQLRSNSETASPIVGVPAGRKKRVNMAWRGDPINDPDLKGIFEMLDRLEDRRKAILFQPNEDLPFLYFGRLSNWSMSGSRPFEISVSIETDGLGQVTQ